MSSRRLLRAQLQMLYELRAVMAAMKNLSLMETNKLRRFIATQMRVVASIEAMAGDFLFHYPQEMASPDPGPAVYLLLGSERGFCGDFNTALLRAMEEQPAAPGAEPVLIPVGRKLAAKLEGDRRVGAVLESSSVAEEVQQLLGRLVETLGGLRPGGEPFSPLSLTVFYHELADDASVVKVSRPLHRLAAAVPRHTHPPMLTMAPESFFGELVDQYLFAALQAFLYSSLMAEHQRRLQHLDGAIRRLDRQRAELTRRDHALRQEEITEEIELILLSAEMAGGPADWPSGQPGKTLPAGARPSAG